MRQWAAVSRCKPPGRSELLQEKFPASVRAATPLKSKGSTKALTDSSGVTMALATSPVPRVTNAVPSTAIDACLRIDMDSLSPKRQVSVVPIPER